MSYFESVAGKLNLSTLRQCQSEAFAALANYYGSGGAGAACVMSVGAGKTALGVVACLAFARRRAMVVTPGSVIRGTFDQAFDHEALRNVLYGLPGGPLIPGMPPPKVLTLDRDDGPIKGVTREQLLSRRRHRDELPLARHQRRPRRPPGQTRTRRHRLHRGRRGSYRRRRVVPAALQAFLRSAHPA